MSWTASRANTAQAQQLTQASKDVQAKQDKYVAVKGRLGRQTISPLGVGQNQYEGVDHQEEHSMRLCRQSNRHVQTRWKS